MTLVRLFPLMFLFACTDKTPADDTADADTDSDTDADTDSDTDADTDADTDTDTDADTDLFLDATGTFNGAAFTVHCDAAGLLAARSDTVVNAICTDYTTTDYWSVAIGAVAPTIGGSTTCDLYHSVQVTKGATTEYYACTLGGATSFSMQIDEVTEVGDGSLTWAGSFAMAGADDADTTSVSGTFRVNSAP